jgi:hypothetical protein
MGGGKKKKIKVEIKEYKIMLMGKIKKNKRKIGTGESGK